MLTVKVALKNAQKAKHFLLDNNLFNKKYNYSKNKNYIYYPVNKQFEAYFVEGFEDKELKEYHKPISWREALQAILTEKELEIGRFGYDTVGSIAIIEIIEELIPKEKEMAQLLLDTNPVIKTVLKKGGGHIGELRTQETIYIAGENTKETVVHENNIKLLVNVETVYYSIRLGTERNRIMKLVQPDEKILCMFSGVAPYPIVLSKNTEASEIVGVELNPEGHKYGLKNINLNKCTNITLHQGDVNDVVPKLNQKFDRITMPLPHTGEEFLPISLNVIKSGGTIHHYCFIERDKIEEEQKRLINLVNKHNKKIKSITPFICGQHSPSRYRVCYDIIIE